MPDPHSYLLLKLSQALFQRPPSVLKSNERQRVEEVARRQLQIEQRILATPEAAHIHVPHASVTQAIAEIRSRYSSEKGYRADLDHAGLDQAELAAAIERDLKFEALLERVASQEPQVSDIDVEIFYLLHRERFHRPENRTLRHILVTTNDSVSGNDRFSARRKIESILDRLAKSPGRFAEQAMKHSECPTAVNGGLLGTVKRGQLFPELESVAFALKLGELSGVVESPMGFHVLHCVAIEDASILPLAVVREKIRTHLTDWRRQSAQKTWIASLYKKDSEQMLPTIQ